MHLHQVNWRDFDSVFKYARHVSMRAPSVRMIIYWSMTEGIYKLTSVGAADAGMHNIVAFVGGKHGEE